MPPRYAPKKSSHISLLLVGVILGIGILTFLSNRAQAAIMDTDGHVVMADYVGQIRSASRLNTRQLQTDIQAIIDDSPGMNIGIAFHDFVTGKTLTYGNSSSSFVAASVPKLLTASTWLHEVDLGKRTLDEKVQGTPAGELLKSLIEVSDNNAWEMLDTELGKPALESYAKEIGMKKYNFDKNAVSPDDILLLLQKLYTGSLLKPDSQKLLLGHMNRANYTMYIMAVLPDSAKGYHKVGFLEDRVLDTAIVENGGLSYALVIFTENKGGFDLASAGSTVRQIAKTFQTTYEK